MNKIIILSYSVCNIDDGNITTTSNITTNDINLNLGAGRSLSVLSNLEDKATYVYTDVFTLSGLIYRNNNYIMKTIFTMMLVVYQV